MLMLVFFPFFGVLVLALLVLLVVLYCYIPFIVCVSTLLLFITAVLPKVALHLLAPLLFYFHTVAFPLSTHLVHVIVIFIVTVHILILVLFSSSLQL